MRVRTEEKRLEIMRIAGELFDELGYERTSMSAIAARVGGSKATLYGYFASKEELLRAVLDQAVNEEADRLRSEEHTSELQSLAYLVCRLLLEKKKKKKKNMMT